MAQKELYNLQIRLEQFKDHTKVKIRANSKNSLSINGKTERLQDLPFQDQT